MKKILPLLFLFSISVLCFGQKIKPNSDFSFYENKGQIVDQKGQRNKDVKFLYISNGLNIQLKKTGFSYDVYETERKEISGSKKSVKSISQKEKPNFKITQKFHRVDIDFVNSNPSVEIVAEDKSADYDNYYNIPDVPKGITNVHRYKKVTYKNIYPNVDLEFFKPNDTLKPVEYNFIVKPGGKISNIQLKFNGAKTKLKDGKLSMNLRFGEMQENIPNSWIEDLNSKKDIKINFKETGNQTFGFESSQDVFDKTIVIDPVPTRIWATYYFGSSYEPSIKKVRTDKDDNVITTTQVNILSNNNIVTTGAFQTNFKDVDEYSLLSKFSKDGKRLWSTFIGNYSYYVNGGLMNLINDCTINSNNEIYIVGKAVERISNFSNNITTTGAHKEKASGSRVEGEIMKFDENGGRIWGTYFGGDNSDEILSVSLDSNQDLIISGRTYSDTGISTANPYKSFVQNSYYIGFFAKFSAAGNQIYGSYLPDVIYHNAVDKNDNYIFCAYSYDKNFPSEGTAGTHQPVIIGQANSLIIKFDKNFNKLWGTYYGGTLLYGLSGQHDGENFPFGIGTDSGNNIYIAGNTTAKQNIATSNSHKENFGGTGSDVFLAKLDEKGNRIWGTYYGADTSFDDEVHDLFVKADGSSYIAGVTGNSTDIATPNGFINDFKRLNNFGGFLSKFNSSGEQIWGTYYPEIFSVFNSKNNVYTYGSSIDNFGTAGTFMPNAVYGATYLVSKFQDCPDDLTASSNSPICPNSDINLKSSGGTSYLWTGPNGFTSAIQNPVISNAKTINSGTYYCKITGSGDCDGTFSTDVKVEDKIAPVPNLATLPDIKGDCKTVVSIIPTATDTCAGKIIATTKNPLQYSIPGTYVIVWDYDDGNGNIAHQNQNVIISSPALPIANAMQEFCATNNSTISDLQITGQNITWYDSAGTVLDTTSKLVNGDFYASQNTNGCESAKIKVTVKINITPLPTGNADQDFCSTQGAKISDLKVIGTSLKFYDLAGNPIPTSTLLLDNTSYFVTQTINFCESEKLEIKVIISQNALPANDFSLTICNETTANVKIEDLTKYQENLITNSASYLFEYFDQNQVSITDFKSRTISIGDNNFYVKVSTKDGCFKLVKLTLQLNAKPEINLPETAEFCNGLSVELNAGFSPNYTYLWNTGEKTSKIIVNKEGTYSVKVSTPFSCENTASIIVKKSILADILKVEIFNNNATIILSAIGNFLYSLDNMIFQTSNEFKNLNNGSYTVYVKTQQGCIIGEMNFSIFNVSNSFTPNGDGKNDTWKISGLENYPNSEVSVYDASGKRVFYKITSGSFEWDGKLNGRNLQTATYWYTVKVSDGRILTGYLLLKNRN